MPFPIPTTRLLLNIKVAFVAFLLKKFSLIFIDLDSTFLSFNGFRVFFSKLLLLRMSKRKRPLEESTSTDVPLLNKCYFVDKMIDGKMEAVRGFALERASNFL